MSAKVKATATYHEWQTDTLAAASTSNAVIEGDDATTDAAAPTVRLGNYCQISDKVARVTGTQRAVNSAGRADELTYQMVKRAKELKRDMEAILLANQARAAASDTAARTTAGVPAWLTTNTSAGLTGADPSPIGADARDDGTQRAFTEPLLKGVLASCWENGGEPDVIMLGSFNKQVASGFTGGATRMDKSEDKKLYASIDVYVSDFGELKIVPNRFMRSRDCLILQRDMWAIAYLRNMKTVELAKTGDSDRRQIICEYALEARNEAASGGVFDLTTA